MLELGVPRLATQLLRWGDGGVCSLCFEGRGVHLRGGVCIRESEGRGLHLRGEVCSL